MLTLTENELCTTSATACFDCILHFLGISYAKVWLDSQCRNIGGVVGNLEDCKAACKALSGCTAVNFSAALQDCVLRACSTPVPVPTHYVKNYIGYTVDV